MASGNPFAGTYDGLATITLSARGVPPETISGTIQFVIDARGNVTSDPASSASGSGRLKGNSFTVTVPGARFNQPGLRCSGALLMNGTVSGNTITGTFAASGLSHTVAGSAARALAGAPAVTALRRTLGTVH